MPHGGGGPGMGPIGVKAHLAPYLPGHPATRWRDGVSGRAGVGGAVRLGIDLTISYIYILMMSGEGLRRATEITILMPTTSQTASIRISRCSTGTQKAASRMNAS